MAQPLQAVSTHWAFFSFIGFAESISSLSLQPAIACVVVNLDWFFFSTICERLRFLRESGQLVRPIELHRNGGNGRSVSSSPRHPPQKVSSIFETHTHQKCVFAWRESEVGHYTLNYAVRRQSPCSSSSSGPSFSICH